MIGPWEILETHEYAAWFAELTDRVSSSRHHNMKELRISSSGAIRILFAFDDARRAVLLLGGIKSEENKWNEWYAESVTRADGIMDRHLGQMRR